MHNLFLDPQFVDQHPPPLLFRKAALGYSPAAIEFDALSESHTDEGITLNEPGMEFVVEGTPGTCVGMTRTELFSRRRELLKAALQPIGHVHWTKSDLPVIVVLGTPDTPRWMLDRGSCLFLQW